MNSLRISGFDPKLTTSNLLYELFCQGGPIKSISLKYKPEPNAFVRFQHDESVPYCLALFDGIELHGRLLRLNPLRYNKNTHSYLDYLKDVRRRLRDEYAKIEPPKLPPKSCPAEKCQIIKDRRSNRKKMKDRNHANDERKPNKIQKNIQTEPVKKLVSPKKRPERNTDKRKFSSERHTKQEKGNNKNRRKHTPVKNRSKNNKLRKKQSGRKR